MSEHPDLELLEEPHHYVGNAEVALRLGQSQLILEGNGASSEGAGDHMAADAAQPRTVPRTATLLSGSASSSDDSDNEFDEPRELLMEHEDLSSFIQQAKVSVDDEETIAEAQEPVRSLDELHINPDEPVERLGTVLHVISLGSDGLSQVVIEGALDTAPVEPGSALCLSERVPLGWVEDVFGPVTRPLYSLRTRAVPSPGAPVFTLTRQLTRVLPAQLLQQQHEAAVSGSDSDEPSKTPTHSSTPRSSNPKRRSSRRSRSHPRPQPAPFFVPSPYQHPYPSPYPPHVSPYFYPGYPPAPYPSPYHPSYHPSDPSMYYPPPPSQ